MMHCTMDDLVALRDGEGSVWARRHIEECEACREELERLYQRIAQLKALVPLRPPRDRWPVVREAIEVRRAHRRRLWAGYGLAAAAAVAGVMVFGPLTGNTGIAEELAQAKQASAQLESTLREYDPEGRVMSGREAELTAQLEDQIAALDGQIGQGVSERTQLVDLWRQRVDLMQQLVQVRITRAKYVGL
jgi:anti-sigma factor RsiW